VTPDDGCDHVKSIHSTRRGTRAQYGEFYLGRARAGPNQLARPLAAPASDRRREALRRLVRYERRRSPSRFRVSRRKLAEGNGPWPKIQIPGSERGEIIEIRIHPAPHGNRVSPRRCRHLIRPTSSRPVVPLQRSGSVSRRSVSGISANPYVQFTTVAERAGSRFSWIDDEAAAGGHRVVRMRRARGGSPSPQRARRCAALAQERATRPRTQSGPRSGSDLRPCRTTTSPSGMLWVERGRSSEQPAGKRKLAARAATKDQAARGRRAYPKSTSEREVLNLEAASTVPRKRMCRALVTSPRNCRAHRLRRAPALGAPIARASTARRARIRSRARCVPSAPRTDEPLVRPLHYAQWGKRLLSDHQQGTPTPTAYRMEGRRWARRAPAARLPSEFAPRCCPTVRRNTRLELFSPGARKVCRFETPGVRR